MRARFDFAKGALLAGAACISLATPQFAAAQPGPDYDSGHYDNSGQYDSQNGTYYDPCKRSQVDRSVVGGVLGAVAGATLGNSVTHGGAKLGGALIGGAAGAAVGAGIGHASAACDSGQPVPYADQRADAGFDGPPPPPPPPPPGAYIPPDNDRYAGAEDRGEYAPPPPPRERCQMVEDRVFFPDGTTESSSVQACRDGGGHWRVAD